MLCAKCAGQWQEIENGKKSKNQTAAAQATLQFSRVTAHKICKCNSRVGADTNQVARPTWHALEATLNGQESVNMSCCKATGELAVAPVTAPRVVYVLVVVRRNEVGKLQPTVNVQGLPLHSPVAVAGKVLGD